MFVAVLHNAIATDAAPDEQDVLVQVDLVSQALRSLGHEVAAVPVTLDLESLRSTLTARRPAVVFNLIESLGGTDRLACAAAILLESLEIPFTGSGADALYMAGSKRLTKERLIVANLPTPAAAYPLGRQVELIGDDSTVMLPGRFLLKSLHEHASFGMDDAAVQPIASVMQLSAAFTERTTRYGKPFFAERYIDGREFNLSVLDRGDGSPQVLPPAEITFENFPDGKPRIVGYAAKWDDDSFEFRETPRRFDMPAGDASLLDSLSVLAAKAWTALRVGGYARVDFRVDEEGRSWIIEVNTNPCLSPDAGFAAALDRAGIPFSEAVNRILTAAVR